MEVLRRLVGGRVTLLPDTPCNVLLLLITLFGMFRSIRITDVNMEVVGSRVLERTRQDMCNARTTQYDSWLYTLWNGVFDDTNSSVQTTSTPVSKV